MSRSDTVLWDPSVTFRHNNINGKEYWSNLIYLISKNLFLIKYGVEEWVLIEVLDVVIDGVPIMVLLSMIHVFLFSTC